MTTFVSRGSNRWPAGASVTTSTIAGHRDMSMTTCPGDAAYPLVKEAFPAEVTAVLAARRPPPAPPSEPPRRAAVGGPGGDGSSGGHLRWIHGCEGACRGRGRGRLHG